MLLLSKEDIKRVFSMGDAIQASKQAFRMVSQRRCQVPQRVNIQVPAQDGCFLFMPVYAEELKCASLKTYGFFPHNLQKGRPSSYAQVFLIDGETGETLALLDGTYLTQVRTGAASGAAFDVLGRKDARYGALIGTGTQAAAQLEAMLAVRKLEEVKVFSPHPDHVRAFVARMSRELAGYGTKITAAASSDEAVASADLIITATPSGTPVFNGELVKAGAVISCVGAYQHHMQELDPAALRRADKLYFDSQEAVLAESGDILIPLEQGLISPEDFSGELGEVLLSTRPGRENDDEIIIFETVGTAAQDLAAALQITLNAQQAGVGTSWG